MEVTTQIAVAWDDIDGMGHVNNLAILRYIQTARINLCHKGGVMPEYVSPHKGPIVASISVQFRKPLFFPDTVTIKSVLKGTQTTSFTLEHRLYSSAGELIAEESEVLVYFDYTAQHKLALPSEFTALSRGEAQTV